MKHKKEFDEFLDSSVNLNASRITNLKSRVDAITNFLRKQELYKDHFIKISPQGSWAQQTIIKPSEKNNEFDADILFYTQIFEKWVPKLYCENLYRTFKNSGTYSDKVSRKTRCVTLDYADEFHIDIIPAYTKPNSDYDTITNRNENTEESTRPDAFNRWLELKNSYTTKNHLRKVIKIAKYMRDIKGNFSIKSILLTTLLASQVNNSEIFGDQVSDCYPDLPTSIKTIFNRLNDFLQSHPTMPEIQNPVLPGESFNRNSDHTKYNNFREKIKLYTDKINLAYNQVDELESAIKWREVFGDDFAPGLVEDAANRALISENLSHIEQPGWERKPSGKVLINAHLYNELEGKLRLGGLNSNGRKIQKSLGIKYVASVSRINPPYQIFWQVVNTGREAAKIPNGLRGKIFNGWEIQWESTAYTGKHWVECFIVKEGYLVARSGRFYINVQ